MRGWPRCRRQPHGGEEMLSDFVSHHWSIGACLDERAAVSGHGALQDSAARSPRIQPRLRCCWNPARRAHDEGLLPDLTATCFGERPWLEALAAEGSSALL